MSYWFHPVDDSRNYTVSRIPEWFQIFGGLDYLRTTSKPWSWCGAYSFNCVFTLCTKRTPIICKKKVNGNFFFCFFIEHFRVRSLRVRWACDLRSHSICLSPFFLFNCTHIWMGGDGNDFLTSVRHSKREWPFSFSFFLFWFIWFTSPLSLLPSGWMSMSFPSPRKLFFLF